MEKLQHYQPDASNHVYKYSSLNLHQNKELFVLKLGRILKIPVQIETNNGFKIIPYSDHFLLIYFTTLKVT